MSATQVLDDRQHAVEFQKTLDSWRRLRLESRTSLHILAGHEPVDAQTERARAIIQALKTHGRPTARFVASQTGSSESGAILWWTDAQLAESFSRDNESAAKFDDIRLIVDNALLQVEAAATKEVGFVKLAIEQARKCVGEDERVHPKVGAVVVRDGVVLTTAYRGELTKGDHAEYTALEKKLPDETLAGGILYTTLEPCTTRNHPKIPCAQRIIDRKFRRVVIGMLDPNPRICGKGERFLRDHGIEVERFPHEFIMQLEEMNRDFVRAHTLTMPTNVSDTKAAPRSDAKRQGPVLATAQDVIARLKAAGELESIEEYQAGFEAGHAWAQETASPGELRRMSAYFANFDSRLDWWDVDYPGWNAPFGATDYFVFDVWPDRKFDRDAPDEFWEQALGDQVHRVQNADFFHGFGDGADEVWRQAKDQF